MHFVMFVLTAWLWWGVASDEVLVANSLMPADGVIADGGTPLPPPPPFP